MHRSTFLICGAFKETAKVKEGEINLTVGALRLYDTKMHDPRGVRLNRTAIEIVLRRWQGNGQWLFRSSRGPPLTRAIIGQAFKRVCKRAGLTIRPMTSGMIASQEPQSRRERHPDSPA